MLETFEDGQTVAYQYDNSGNLATVTASETGIVTTYYYDLLNRLVGYREKSATLDHAVTYTYDAENNLSSMVEVANGVTKTYSYTYDEDNRLTSMSVDGTTITYSYDDFGRVSNRTVKNGDTVIESITPGYYETETTTSGQIVSYNGYSYTYDKNGNILTVSDGTNTTSYVYDSQNQLIRENNQAQGYTHTWTYDNAGNILERKEYAYTTGELGTPLKTISYTYNAKKWKDLLRSYDGNTITYDGVGNPTSDGTWVYSWKHGRQLVSMQSDAATWTYTYDANGMRTSRSNGTDTYTYVYNGSKLVAMTKGTDTLQFAYDASGTSLSVTYNGTTYYYSTNLQGDILRILDGAGTAVVNYSYDAWGVLLSCTGTMADTLGTLNPLRYRGYVYDTETELYYLQSRYYNPEWGRFINADAYVATGQGLLGNNMFAYCNNNPIRFSDPTGNTLIEALIVKVGTEWAFTLVIAGVVIFSGIIYKTFEAILNWLSKQWYSFCVQIKYVTEEPKQVEEKTEQKDEAFKSSSSNNDYDDDDDYYNDENNFSSTQKIGNSKGNTPGNNRTQNKQFRDATKGLTSAQKRFIHDMISKKGLGFHEIKKIVKDVFVFVIGFIGFIE